MQGLEELYRAYRTDVYRYLLSLTRDATAAEDLLSETFLRALQSLSGFRGQSAVKTWLFGITRNVWLQSLQKMHPNLEYDDMLGLYLEDTFAADLQQKEQLARVIDFRAKQWLRQMWEQEDLL